MGVAGEVHKLSTQERSEITAKTFEAVAGRCSIIIGTSSNTTEEVISEYAGAAAVMVVPPKGLQLGPQLIEHYSNMDEAARSYCIKPRKVFLTHFKESMIEADPVKCAEALSRETLCDVIAVEDNQVYMLP